MTEILIRSPKSNTINTRWIAVDFDGKYWHCRQWIVVNGQEKRIRQARGNDGKSWWEWLREHCHNGETWWIVGWDIYEFFCWTGMYEAIKDFGFYLTDNGKFANNIKQGQASRKLFGALICENPPTIVDGYLPNGSKLKILDLANLGLRRKMFNDNEDLPHLDDCVQAVQDFCSLVKELDMGELKTTAASQGWYCYRRSHMRHELFSDNEPIARKIERNGYFAGRCEAYRLGRLPGYIIHLDVTSMYSSIAYYQSFPTRLEWVALNPESSKIDVHSTKYHWIADVELETTVPHFPVRYNGKVIYPVGKFRTTLCWPELQVAIKGLYIRKYHALAKYKCQPIFHSFSKWYLAALKQLGMLGLEHLTPALKLIVNSTYGKIGQRSKSWVDHSQQVPVTQWGQWWQRHPEHRKPVQFRSIDGLTQYLDAGGEGPVSMPSISATMSSYGRAAISLIMQLAGHENVYYLDTDGIMVNVDGYKRLKDHGYCEEKHPGKLKVREEGKNVEIFGLKNYLFEGRYCCAGIPDRNLLIGKESVEFDQHFPFTHSLFNRQAFPHGYNRIKRKRSRKYQHGHVFPDGKIAPWIMAELERSSDDTETTRRKEKGYAIMGYQDLPSRDC